MEPLNLVSSALLIPLNDTWVFGTRKWRCKLLFGLQTGSTRSCSLRHINGVYHWQSYPQPKWLCCLEYNLSKTSTESSGTAHGQWQSCDNEWGKCKLRRLFVQSFDYPSDIILSGMKVGWDLKLTWSGMANNILEESKWSISWVFDEFSNPNQKSPC